MSGAAEPDAAPSSCAALCRGLLDAVWIIPLRKSVQANPNIRRIYGQALLLNVVVLSGSVWTLTCLQGSISQLIGLEDTYGIFAFIAYLLWEKPVYFIGYPMNLIWSTEIFEHAYADKFGRGGRQRPGAGSAAGSAAASETAVDTIWRVYVGARSKAMDKIYYYLVIVAMMSCSELLRVLPLLAARCTDWLRGAAPASSSAWLGYWAGLVAHLVMEAWIYAFFAYDPRFSQHPVSFGEKAKYFERKWAYFLGFGLPSWAVSTPRCCTSSSARYTP
eukprot:TRINITY_DN2084_c0_g1_i1.p1 TRINITY_DN2084_c0_g1~~TRINITY_DN2084_c0_g1_i1.p1  ORF type:complete len:275 (+),score=63.73 TRINITY_DN2084_c0_g1_i1:78-902(+)